MRKRHRLPRAKASPFSPLKIEPLEMRTLLAASIFDVGNISDDPTNSSLTDYKNGDMSNVSEDLTKLYVSYRKFRNGGGADSDFQIPTTDDFMVGGTRIGVTIRTFGTLSDMTDLVRQLNGVILYRTNLYKAIDAMIPLTQMHALAANSLVASVNPIYRGQSLTAGSANNQADQAELADLIRSTYGLDGTGVKIGVLSTSVNLEGDGLAGSVATGDLPPDVQVIADSSPALDTQGTLNQDEGRAMLELIHDIAPGAKLAFATAMGGQQVFADHIRALRTAGCNIIVDDFTYFAEPYFQPGVIDQAISDVVASGAVYLSAAGNEYNAAYDAPISYTGPSSAQLVDWNPSSRTDTRLEIDVTVPAGSTTSVMPMFLEWDNPYNGIAGNVSTDLDVYNYGPTGKLFSSSTANNFRTGVPVEEVLVRPGRNEIEVRVAGTTIGKALPTRIKFVIFNGASGITPEFPGTQGSIVGHNGSADAISVGAVPFTAAPPFSSISPIFNDNFSSHGPVTQVFDANGNRLPTSLTLQKPDVSGIDGGNTSFFDGLTDIQRAGIIQAPGLGDIIDPNDPDIFPNFFGTSAAAPDVAAVVALMLQAAPNATEADILTALKSTATPLDGSTAGTFDPQGGFGLINGLAAISQFVAPPTVSIEPVDPDPSFAPIDSITVKFSQQISGFDVSDLFLSNDGETNLLTGLNSPTTTDGGRTWIVPNLSVVTATPGDYIFQLDDLNASIQNTIGASLSAGATSTFTIRATPGNPKPPSDLRVANVTSSSVTLAWKDNAGTVNEQGFEIQRSDVPDFSADLKHFTVGEGVTTFTDTSSGITGKKLYYRVRAFNVLGVNSTFSSTVTTTTLSPGEIVLDNDDSKGVKVTGVWDSLTTGSGFLGDTYLDDLNSNKGDNSVKFTPTITKSGQYFVYARWVSGSNRATNVPVDIKASGGKRTVTVDERHTGGAGWILLGEFKFDAGTDSFVLFRTDNTNGHVIVDAVRFLAASA